MIFVKSSKRIKDRLKSVIEKEGIKNVSKNTGYSENNIRRYLRGDRSMPFEFCKYVSKSLNVDIWNLLENEDLKSMTSNRNFKIKSKISTDECNIVGWILTDGHLNRGSKMNKTFISQKNINTLNKLKQKIIKNFKIKKGVSISADKNNWKLNISLSALRNYFNIRYGIPLGNKSKIIRVPDMIFSIDKEHQLSFISGCLEGDGTFSFLRRTTKRGKYKIPRIAISTSSRQFSEDIKQLFVLLDYDKVKINSSKDEYKINLLKIKDCAKLFFEIYSYMLHEDKISNFIKILSYKEILDIIRIENAGILMKEYKKKNKLSSKCLSKILTKNYYKNINYRTAEGWRRNAYPMPLSILIYLCDNLKKDYFEFVPIEFSGLLWIHKLIKKKVFLNFRKEFS